MAGQGMSMRLLNPYMGAPSGELTSVLLGLCSCLIVTLLLALLVKVCLRQRCHGCWAPDDHLLTIGTLLMILYFAINCYLFLNNYVVESSDFLPSHQALLIAIWIARWMKDLTTIFAKLPIFLLCARSFAQVAYIQVLARAGAICSVIFWGSLSIAQLAMSSPRAGQSWHSAVDKSATRANLIFNTTSSSLETITTLYIILILCVGISRAEPGTATRPGLIATVVTACFSLATSIIALTDFILAGTRQQADFAQAGIVSSMISNQIILLSTCTPALATFSHDLRRQWRIMDEQGRSAFHHLTRKHKAAINHTRNESNHSFGGLSVDSHAGSENWLSGWDYLPPPPHIWAGSSNRRMQDHYKRYSCKDRRRIFARDHRSSYLLSKLSSSNTALIPPSSRELHSTLPDRSDRHELLGDRILVETDIMVEESRAAPEDAFIRAF